MNVITYTKKNLIGKSILGYTLIIFGLITLVQNILFGFIFIAIGINLVGREGSEIDITSKTYRSIWSVFGIKFGKWKSCPEFEYVSVFKTKENQTVNVVTASATTSTDIILLNLFYGNKHITFYKTDDKTDAFKVAEHFKYALKVDILDATGKEKIWL